MHFGSHSHRNPLPESSFTEVMGQCQHVERVQPAFEEAIGVALAMWQYVLKNGCVSKEASQTSKLRKVHRFFWKTVGNQIYRVSNICRRGLIANCWYFLFAGGQEADRSGEGNGSVCWDLPWRISQHRVFVRLDQARTFPLIGGAAQADDMACVAPMGMLQHCIALHRILAGGKPLRRHLCLFPGTGVVGDDATDRW